MILFLPIKCGHCTFRKRILWTFVIATSIVAVCVYIVRTTEQEIIPSPPLSVMNAIKETRLRQLVLVEKGAGCEMPYVNPFSDSALKNSVDIEHTMEIVCSGQDWVKCNQSECGVTREVLATKTDISCDYKDIVHVNDSFFYYEAAVKVLGDAKYRLIRSDHVKVSCKGMDLNGIGLLASHWEGQGIGFRAMPLRIIPAGREHTPNILIFGLDSTSHNGFIRRMRQSYKYLKYSLGAVILNKHNILGDGTPAALFPILTGKDELEQPDARKGRSNDTIHQRNFIFHHLKQAGYRTSYLEDIPIIEEYQLRFNGFSEQPSDHYVRSFLLAADKKKWFDRPTHCIGDTPKFQLLTDITEKFMNQGGKKFAFTLLSDIDHNDFELISNADDTLALCFKRLSESKVLDNTVLIVMGDHGSRFESYRETYEGKIEERLPFMAIVLPKTFKERRPDAVEALEHNKEVLTTHLDLHSTLLDIVNLKQHANPYKVPGSDLPRAFSLLEKIPMARSCSDAGILPHWCACLKWRIVDKEDNMHKLIANALAESIDHMTDTHRSS